MGHAMGKKKGGGGKKKAALSEEELAAQAAHRKKYADLAAELSNLSIERWARLHLICSMDKADPLMRCHIDVPISETRVANLYDYIVGRHGGSISGIQLYNGKKRPENELQQLSAYLCDVGLEGVPAGDPKTYPEYEILYDFKPSSTSCQLLLSEP